MPTYAYLGPAGTFTEGALKKITTSDDVRTPYINVTAALDAVRAGFVDHQHDVAGQFTGDADVVQPVGQPMPDAGQLWNIP